MWIPRGFGFFNELLKGDAVLAALPDVATDAIEPFPAPPTYGLPLASVIEILPPFVGRWCSRYPGLFMVAARGSGMVLIFVGSPPLRA